MKEANFPRADGGGNRLVFAVKKRKKVDQPSSAFLNMDVYFPQLTASS
ncbi:hypothetical protein [Paenibacillus rhizophilus]|nr:hypothetical protein [Paenibacillus rhizophilus]